MAGNTISDEIFALAKTISKAEESEEDTLEMLCGVASDEIEGRLRSGIGKQDCEGAFICASAWIASAALEGARCGEELSSLRAGDLTVKPRAEREREERYEHLRRQAWDLMAPYIEGSGFHFCGVQG